MTMLECMIFFPFPDLMVFTDIVVDVQVIKLMNSALSPVTCGFSFLGILVQEVDLHLEVKDEVVLIGHFMCYAHLNVDGSLYHVLGAILHMLFYLFPPDIRAF